MSDQLTEPVGHLFKTRPWHKLPRLLAMLKLIDIRTDGSFNDLPADPAIA